jgi:copper resistance protein C
MMPSRLSGAVLAAPATPTAVDTSGIPGWVWILVAVVAVLAAAVVLLRLLKGGPKD